LRLQPPLVTLRVPGILNDPHDDDTGLVLVNLHLADSRQILENMVHAAQPRPVTEDHVVFLASIDAPHGAAWQAAVAGLVGWLDHVARVIAEQWRRRVREVCADHPTTP